MATQNINRCVGFVMLASLAVLACWRCDHVVWGVGVDQISSYGRPSGVLEKFKTEICKG